MMKDITITAGHNYNEVCDNHGVLDPDSVMLVLFRDPDSVMFVLFRVRIQSCLPSPGSDSVCPVSGPYPVLFAQFRIQPASKSCILKEEKNLAY